MPVDGHASGIEKRGVRDLPISVVTAGGGKSSNGMVFVAGLAIISFLGAFAAGKYGASLFGRLPLVRDHARQPDPTILPPPNVLAVQSNITSPAVNDITSPAVNGGPSDFIRGKWVRHSARCDTTDNFAVFFSDGFAFKAHGESLGRKGPQTFAYSREGNLISVDIGQHVRVARVSFRVKSDDVLTFAGLALQPEADAAFSGSSHDGGDAVDADRWRELFGAYLPMLKRCPQ
jgi:hypothetical protein